MIPLLVVVLAQSEPGPVVRALVREGRSMGQFGVAWVVAEGIRAAATGKVEIGRREWTQAGAFTVSAHTIDGVLRYAFRSALLPLRRNLPAVVGMAAAGMLEEERPNVTDLAVQSGTAVAVTEIVHRLSRSFLGRLPRGRGKGLVRVVTIAAAVALSSELPPRIRPKAWLEDYRHRRVDSSITSKVEDLTEDLK